jgi:hypothetical protein
MTGTEVLFKIDTENDAADLESLQYEGILHLYSPHFRKEKYTLIYGRVYDEQTVIMLKLKFGDKFTLLYD